MHPDQHVGLALHRTADHRHVLLTVEQRLVDVAGEVAPRRRDVGLGDALDQLLLLAPVADHLGDRDHQQAVLLSEPLELGHPGHVHLVLVDDLAQDPRRVQPGHPGEVDRCLGVPGTLEHATLA